MPRLPHCLIAIAFVAACDQATVPRDPEAGTLSAASTQTPITTTQKIPIDGTAFFFSDCLGEQLEVHLREQLVIHTTEVPGETLHLHVTDNDKGTTAEGLTSGASYHRVGATIQNLNLPGFPVVTQTIVNVFHFIGEGGAPSLLVNEVFHISINANNVVTVEFDHLKIQCK
jgi:hypothetical protein